MWIDDVLLERCKEKIAFHAWIPESPLVVLGSGNRPERECYFERCANDGISVLKRCGGGGTVVLHPGCVVVSLGLWVQDYYKNNVYFHLLNQAVIASLGQFWPKFSQLEQKGLSDIALGEKKVAGTSLYRSRNYLLYQASLLVHSRLDLIERYLPHPSREPDYRKGKSHAEFMGCLADFVDGLHPTTVLECMQELLRGKITELLAEELVDPVDEQVTYLLKKATF